MASLTAKALCCLVALIGLSLGQAAHLDVDVLQFALNLEYLEANFYSCAATGQPIPCGLWGNLGVMPTGCMKAKLTDAGRAVALDIAADELAHVQFLRNAIMDAGVMPVDQPEMDIGMAFSTAANAAFNATLSPSFDAYANDLLFYHAAYIFEDVGVTAYLGAIDVVSAEYLSATSGLLGTEAYHAGAIRTLLINRRLEYIFPYGVPTSSIVQAISNLRAAASGTRDGLQVPDDIGIMNQGTLENILVPADANALPFARTPAQVLSIVYLGGSGSGGFFPMGMNGNIK